MMAVIPPVISPVGTDVNAGGRSLQTCWQTIGNGGTAKLRDYGTAEPCYVRRVARKPRETVGRKTRGLNLRSASAARTDDKAARLPDTLHPCKAKKGII